MLSPARSFSERVLHWLAHAIYYHRRWFFYPQAALIVLSILYTTGLLVPGKKLEFHTKRSALVGGEKEYHQLYQRFKEEFPVQEDLVLVVESDEIEKNRQFVERLGAKLEAETNLFGSVFYKADLPMMGPKALLFPPEEALKNLCQTLREYRPFLIQFTKATNLVSLFNLINTQFRTARREENAENTALIKALPALERIITQATDALQRPGNPPSPGITSLFEGGPEAESRMYITFASNRMYLVTAQAKKEELNADAVKRMRQLIAETQLEVPGLNVGLTGEPVLEVDEMAQSEHDTMVATIVSVILVALIFIYGYHETGRPLKATACLLVGLVYTMGFTTLTVGHLNVLTITFVPILVGLAIDFGVHLITRYEEELRRGRTELYALEKAIVYTGMGIFTGAFTTAGAFFAMGFTDFKGIREMGIICGGGLLVCLAPMMTLLPVLLLRGQQNILDHELGPVLDRQTAVEVDRRARIENVWLRRPVSVIIIILVLSGLALMPARKVSFDYNLLHMQSKGLPAVVFQEKLIRSSNKSVLFAAVVTDSLPEATDLAAKLTNLPVVASVESMAPYLTEDQRGKLALLKEIKKVATEICFGPVDLSPLNVSNLTQTLFGLHGYCGAAASTVKNDEPELYQQLLLLRQAVERLQNHVRLAERGAVAEKLADFQQALFIDVRETFLAIQHQDDRERLRIEDLPAALRNRFIGVTGKFLLQVYPKEDVWDRNAQERFISELRKQVGDKAVTGTPVQLYEYTKLLKKSFEEAALYSLAAIAVMVFVHFRSMACVILSLLPVVFGFLWMLGVMGIFEISFNPANVMTLPLIVGIGVTNGIHILNRFVEEQHPSILARSTGKAVLVSGLTAIAGFGSLILAQHQGIRSLGYVMSTGIATCMLVGLTFLPAILNLLNKHGWIIKKTQRDNARSTLGREEPR